MGSSVAADGAFIVVLDGDLDVYRAGEVRLALDAARAKRRLIVDLSCVHSLSASVLTEFIRNYKQRLAAGLEPARLVITSALVRRIFEITNLAKLWRVYDSIDAASVP